MNMKININADKNLKAAVIYLFTAAFAFIFDRIYALFSHGVFSRDMFSMWIFLIYFGAGFYILLYFICNKTKFQPDRLALNIYNSGAAVFVTGMLLNGIFEIAGTGSVFILYYKIAGIILMSAGFILILFKLYKKLCICRKIIMYLFVIT